MQKSKIFLLLILFLALVLRFWKLGSYPALNADEAAVGYNAYSLIRTGLDEHGNSWPIHFQSFNDYKPGLYFYLVLPFVWFLGLNEWAVRIPGAFLGVATVYLVYLLADQLLKIQKNKIENIRYQMVPLLSAFFLAISPWHIHFSRGGWEVNVATFLVVLAILLFLKGLISNVFLFLSSFFFSLSLYTYHAARVITPILVIGLLVIEKDVLKKNIKNFFLAGLVGLMIALPLVKDLTKPEIFSRAAGVGLFADTGPLARINEQRGEHGVLTGLSTIIFHNKLVNYGLAFFENLTEHFEGEFLFLSGDDVQRNKVPETGQMYIFDLLWIMIGISWMLKNLEKKEVRFILFWLVVAPTASALTFQSPSALRSQNMIIPLVLICSFGLSITINFFLSKKINDSKDLIRGKHFKLNRFKPLGLVFIVALISWSFGRYLHMYYVHMAKEYPFSSQYGVRELVTYISENKEKYRKIIVTDRYDQPYILFLFYLKFPPKDFQNNHILTPRDKYGFSTVRGFDKYEFRPIFWDLDQPNNPNSLIIGTDEEIPDEANIIAKIYGINGYKYFEVVAN